MTGSIAWLLAAAAVFVGSHIVLSGTGLRSVIVGAIGERPFLGLFSLVSIAAIVWVAAAYNDAPFVHLWEAGHLLKGLAWLVMLPAVWLLVCGLSTPNPTAIGAERLIEKGDAARGIFTATRHPVMWSFALWALAHVLSNGDLASLILFGGLALLVFAGLASQELKKQTKLGEAWTRFTAKTSFLPFAAILAGRTRLDHAGIGWMRLGATVAVYAALVLLHPWAIGVSPVP